MNLYSTSLEEYVSRVMLGVDRRYSMKAIGGILCYELSIFVIIANKSRTTKVTSDSSNDTAQFRMSSHKRTTALRWVRL